MITLFLVAGAVAALLFISLFTELLSSVVLIDLKSTTGISSFENTDTVESFSSLVSLNMKKTKNIIFIFKNFNFIEKLLLPDIGSG